jgi:hypothetical protein
MHNAPLGVNDAKKLVQVVAVALQFRKQGRIGDHCHIIVYIEETPGIAILRVLPAGQNWERHI